MDEHIEPCLAQQKVRYRECMKNHAAHLGKYAIDGCGEFMPGGADGTLEGLKCGACECHRNFHRQESPPTCHKSLNTSPPLGPFPGPGPGPGPISLPVATPQPLQMMMMMGVEDVGGTVAAAEITRKSRRSRTKFSSVQKAGMHELANKLGWKIQKHDEEYVHDFCTRFGIKRHVLKVWMHNNKGSFSTSPPLNNNNNNSNNTATTSNDNSNSTSEHNHNQLPS